MSDIFRDKPLDREDWNFLSRPPVYLLALGSVLKPASSREVDCLAYVEPCREASVVRSRKGKDKFAWPLQSLVNLNLLLLQVRRRHHRNDV